MTGSTPTVNTRCIRDGFFSFSLVSFFCLPLLGCLRAVQAVHNRIARRQLNRKPFKHQFPHTITPLSRVLSTQFPNFATHSLSPIEVSSDLLSYWQGHSHHSIFFSLSLSLSLSLISLHFISLLFLSLSSFTSDEFLVFSPLLDQTGLYVYIYMLCCLIKQSKAKKNKHR